MAKPASEGVKPYLLLALVLVSVVLVALTWAENLSEPAAGGFVRGTSAAPAVATVTALLAPAQPTATPASAATTASEAPPTAGPPPEAMPTPDE